MKTQKELEEKIKAKKEVSLGEMRMKVADALTNELMNLDPEDMEEAVMMYLGDLGMEDYQIRDERGGAEDNIRLAMKRLNQRVPETALIFLP